MSPAALKVLAHTFASGPPFLVENNWKPRPVNIYKIVPAHAKVIAVPLPTRDGMRIVVYNKCQVPIEVTLESQV